MGTGFQDQSVQSFGTDPENQMQFDNTHQRTWILERVTDTVRRLPLFSGAVVFLLLTGALCMTVGTALGLANFRDVGYPDSASLFKIAEVIRSGHIYSDINSPPYHLTLYGPLTYLLLAIPYRLAFTLGLSSQMLVRLSIVAALGLCVFLIFLLNKRLYNSRTTAWLCALFSVSALPMAFWTTQIRGDLLAVAFSFLSVYLLLLKSGRPWAIRSALCAAVAPLIKQTFLAAPIAIIIWLTYMRRYKDALVWASAFALAVVGGYGIIWWHEPLLLKHLAALRHPVVEYRFAREILWRSLGQPVVPFAVIGGFLSLWKRDRERILLCIYSATAWLVAILTIPNVGGSINYFWEPLLISAVLAGPGLCELQRKVNHTPIVVTAMLFFLLLRSSLPMLQRERDYLRQSRADMSDYHLRKTKWEAFLSAVSGRMVLSTIPEVTVRSATPEMPDPYLNSTLELTGQWNSSPVAAQIDAGVFNLIVIKKGQAEASPLWIYRGVGSWSDAMWGALRRTYRRTCVFDDMEIWLPRRSSAEALPTLSAIGCIPIEKEFNKGPATDGRAQDVTESSTIGLATNPVEALYTLMAAPFLPSLRPVI